MNYVWPFTPPPQLQTSRVFRHACQTPLTTLLSATDFAVKSEHRRSEQKTYLTLAKNAATRLFELFTALDHPQTQRVFSLLSAVYEAAALISPRRADLRIVIDQKLRTNLLKLKGNKLYFTESLICLLNNAHEATPTAHRIPLIMLTVHMRENTQVQLDIIDYGQGMRMASPTQIIWRKRSAHHRGRGVGLWFAHHTLTQLFGGHVITSSSPHGTRVSISLPIHKKHSRKIGTSLAVPRVGPNASGSFLHRRPNLLSWAGLPLLPKLQR